jgi:hypothetical protein
MDQTVTVIFFFSAILIFGGLLFVVISLAKNSPRVLDQNKYRSRWMAIESKLQRNDENTYTLCVFDADKLLDQALRDRGLSGKTMAERMKQYQGKWSNGNGVWAAHKLRNRLAHETDVRIDYDRARQALIAFKGA